MSASAVLVMAFRTYKNVDIYYFTINLSIVVSALGYWVRSTAQTALIAMLANNIACLGSTLLPAIYLFGILRSMNVDVPRLAEVPVYFFSFALLALIWTSSQNHLFYSAFDIAWTQYGLYTITDDGPLKILHYIYLAFIGASVFISCIYGFSHPEKCTLFTALSFFLFTTCVVILYALQLIFHLHYDLYPLVFGPGSWMLAIAFARRSTHDINNIVSTMHDEGTETGYIALDLKRKYIGANETAMDYLPQLKKLSLNKAVFNDKSELSNIVNKIINALEDGDTEPCFVKHQEAVIRFKVKYFHLQKKESTGGYLISVKNDTEHQLYLDFIKNYNRNLQQDIKRQTERIHKIQEQVVMGLANMIENRDESTGGHVKRTSEVVKILVDYMIENHIGNLDRTFADDVIRASPMHDLGKISIDNAILCKPGKLTAEEYEIMKSHPAKSGEIVKTILSGVEEANFIDVAFNVARYHHEKWNGQGYPDHLKENEIPLEARIMAVADVYDALVSKRCYKEAMSFEEAAKVMMESMGSHFDPMMKDVFLGCRLMLEGYYNRFGDA